MSPDRSILLVEDDNNDVVLIERAFRKAGISNPLHVVRHGDDAVHYLAGDGIYSDRQRYPLPMIMLLDLKLPRRSGLEVLSWVRSRESVRRLPIVVLTSSVHGDDVNRAYDLGANSYLVKPVALESLLNLVRALNVYWFLLNQRPDVAPQPSARRAAGATM